MRDNSQRRGPPSVDGVALRLKPLRVVTADGAALRLFAFGFTDEAAALGLAEFRSVIAGAEPGIGVSTPRAAAGCPTAREAKAAARAETYLKVADMGLLLFLGGSPAYAHPDAEKMAHPKPYVRLRDLTGPRGAERRGRGGRAGTDPQGNLQGAAASKVGVPCFLASRATARG